MCPLRAVLYCAVWCVPRAVLCGVVSCHRCTCEGAAGGILRLYLQKKKYVLAFRLSLTILTFTNPKICNGIYNYFSKIPFKYQSF